MGSRSEKNKKKMEIQMTGGFVFHQIPYIVFDLISMRNQSKDTH